MRIVRSIVKVIFISLFMVSNSFAFSLIRDAEIEQVIRNISDPIFAAAGLTHDEIDIYIVNDRQLNAFVAGGSNIFLNTGLIGFSDDPNMLTGVIAHETGHIAGGHLLKTGAEYERSALKSTLGYVLGLAAAVAGSPEAGMAIVQGTNHAIQRQILKHSRVNEEAADQAALKYLDTIGLSSKGLLELMNELYSKQTQLYGDINPYILTHPLSRERIKHIDNHIENSRFARASHDKTMLHDFSMIVAKLNAFIGSYESTMRKFPPSDNSKQARYARAIAHYKKPNLQKSIFEIDSLIKDEPKNPFFHELKGQVLYENGRVDESIAHYQKAVDLNDDLPLLKIVLATAQVASENEVMRKRAISNLKQALLVEKENKFAWRQIAIAYGRGGDIGLANLALAEEYALTENKKRAEQYIETAKKHLKLGTPSYLRAEDLLSAINNDA